MQRFVLVLTLFSPLLSLRLHHAGTQVGYGKDQLSHFQASSTPVCKLNQKDLEKQKAITLELSNIYSLGRLPGQCDPHQISEVERTNFLKNTQTVKTKILSAKSVLADSKDPKRIEAAKNLQEYEKSYDQCIRTLSKAGDKIGSKASQATSSVQPALVPIPIIINATENSKTETEKTSLPVAREVKRNLPESYELEKADLERVQKERLQSQKIREQKLIQERQQMQKKSREELNEKLAVQRAENERLTKEREDQKRFENQRLQKLRVQRQKEEVSRAQSEKRQEERREREKIQQQQRLRAEQQQIEKEKQNLELLLRKSEEERVGKYKQKKLVIAKEKEQLGLTTMRIEQEGERIAKLVDQKERELQELRIAQQRLQMQEEEKVRQAERLKELEIREAERALVEAKIASQEIRNKEVLLLIQSQREQQAKLLQFQADQLKSEGLVPVEPAPVAVSTVSTRDVKIMSTNSSQNKGIEKAIQITPVSATPVPVPTAPSSNTSVPVVPVLIAPVPVPPTKPNPTQYITNPLSKNLIINNHEQIIKQYPKDLTPTQVNDRSCPLSTPYFNGKECISCQHYFNLNSRQCETCPQNSEYDPLGFKCVNTIFVNNLNADNIHLDEETLDEWKQLESTLRRMSPSKIVECPLSTPFVIDSKCGSCPSQTPLFDLVSSKCHKCVYGFKYDQASRKCVVQ